MRTERRDIAEDLTPHERCGGEENGTQLVKALRKHRATSSPTAPPLTNRPGHTGARARGGNLGPRGAGTEGSRFGGSGASGGGRWRADRDAIVYQETGCRDEFHVVVTETGGARRCVAHSPAFHSPPIAQ